MDSGIYRPNISALRHKNADFAEWIEKGSKPEGVELAQGESGSEDLMIRTASGGWIPYYGNGGSNPEKESLFIRGMDLSRGSMTCLIGAGLGHTTGAIMKGMDKGHQLLLLEPNPWILRQALVRVNISEGLLGGSLHVLRPSQINIEDLFVRLINAGILYGNLKIVADPRSGAISNEYEEWVNRVQEAYQYALSLIESATVVQKASIENEIENTVVVALCPAADALRPLFRGKPVLIVGAGPSLDLSIDLIHRARDKVFVFAFAAAWRNLLSHRIVPDFVLTSDKNVQSLGMLRYTKFAQETPLVFSSSALPGFVRKYTGPRYVAPQSALYPLPPSHANHGFSVATGSSVAVFAFNLAIHLEAKPVLLIGLDLAMGPGKESHATGHHLAGTFDSNDPRIREVEGVRGTTVRTLTYLQDIKRHIERCIASSGIKPINATVCGSRIRGTTEMDLDEVSASLPALVKDVLPSPELSPETVRAKLPRDAVERLSEEIRRLRDLSRRSGRSLDRFQKSCRRGAVDPRLADAVSISGKEIQEFLATHPLLNHYFSRLWLGLKQDTQRSLSIQDRKGRLSAEVDKNLRFLRQLTADVEGLLKRVDGVRKEISRASRDGQECRAKAEQARFLLDHGFNRQAFDMAEGTGEEGALIQAEALAARGLLREAQSRLERSDADPQSRRVVSALFDRAANQRKIFAKEAEGVILKGSWVDAALLRIEVERSFGDDPIVSQIWGRLSEKF